MDSHNDITKKDISQIATYESGLIQASAHRNLTRITSDYLLRYGLTSMQWFIVGSIYSSGSAGIRLSDLMRKMHTTLPYITNTITLLESKGVVRKISHSGDSRIKLVSITPSYLPTLEEIELGLREHLRSTLYDGDKISREELVDYITVLYKIVHGSAR